MLNFIKRSVIAALFIPLLLWIFFAGGIPLLAVLGLITFGMLFEMRTFLQKRNIQLPVYTFVFAPIVYFLGAYVSWDACLAAIFVLMVAGVVSDIFGDHIEGSLVRAAISVFALIYIPLLLASAYRIRAEFAHGEIILPALVICIWVTDTFAYIIGMTLGRHRGIFSVSPKKSLEGFVAGFLFAFGAAFAVRYFFAEITITQSVLIGISAGIAGQLGDLIESIIKRDVGIKDSSHIIPGHGGVLDRFDSLLIAAPTLYILLKMF